MDADQKKELAKREYLLILDRYNISDVDAVKMLQLCLEVFAVDIAVIAAESCTLATVKALKDNVSPEQFAKITESIQESRQSVEAKATEVVESLRPDAGWELGDE